MNRSSLRRALPLRCVLGAAAGALLVAAAGAQGANDCGNAQAISGSGDWNFLLFTATTDGLPSSVCQAFGTDQIENDVWFAWTATTTGDVDLDTCVTSTVDTRVAVYDGLGCGSTTPLTCNDDTCGFQSAVTWSAVAGQDYLIRVGVFPGAALGGGQIHVTELGNGGLDDCANAQAISGTGTFPFDNTMATTDGLADAVCGFFSQTQIENDIWFAWTAPDDDGFTISTCGLTTIDSKIAVYDGTSCPTASPIACNDDACGTQTEVNFQAFAGNQYLVRIGNYPGAAAGIGSFLIEAQGMTGGSCSNPATGADVIVGDLIGVENYGGLGNQSAFAIGTTSCNIGTQELLWIANNNEHPVIGQNIYRLDGGRFEQIGMGWLKHGFTALQGSLCCTCNSSGTGSRLGVGCSDPYSASLNGIQPSLGPRSEVNAFTGAFPYPFVNGFNQGGDRVFKRIQVENSDIDPAQRPGAQFFGEGHYVTPDDAGSGNGFNNVSYRPMAITGAQSGGFAMQLTGSTMRTAPAIQAWKDSDPSVNLQDVQIAGEGLFMVGSNAYDNGDGTWNYEYAVYNMNSDLSGQSFSVPIGSGVNVSGDGMSFPDYHSGEPYTNTTWAANVSGGAVTWQTQTHAVNANANALRWGTVYSFWFVADTAPESKSASLGLFKPGNPGAQQVDVMGPMDGAGGPTVTNYCSANANSTGVPGQITARDIDLVARTLILESSSLPNNVFGLYVNSMGQNFVPNLAGSAGNLCIDLPIGRHNAQVVNSGSNGTMEITVDLDAVPQAAGFESVMLGQSWNWQTWFRDVQAGAATSNFTNGVSVQF